MEKELLSESFELFKRVSDSLSVPTAADEIEKSSVSMQLIQQELVKMRDALDQASGVDFGDTKKLLTMLRRMQRQYGHMCKEMIKVHFMVIQCMDANGYGKDS